MGMETFRLGHYFYSFSYSLYSFFRNFLKGNGLHKAIQVYTAVLLCISIGRQGMIGSGSIVPGTFRCIVAYENGTCIIDLIQKKRFFPYTEDIMLRPVLVNKVYCRLIVVHKYQFTVRNGLS